MTTLAARLNVTYESELMKSIARASQPKPTGLAELLSRARPNLEGLLRDFRDEPFS